MVTFRFPRTCRLVSLSLLALVAAGCPTSVKVTAPSVEVSPLPLPEPRSYRLQAGDSVTVKFWNSPELNEDVVLRPDGMISLPFVDEIRAAGLTPAELDAELTRRYAVELAQPDLTVMVTNTPPPVIYVGGEVSGPGAQELRGRRTLFQAIQQAGGFKTTARRKQVILIRTLSAEETVARAVDLRPVMSGADPGVDLLLQPFDVVFVPRTKVEDLRLFVDQYVYGQLPISELSVIRVFNTNN